MSKSHEYLQKELGLDQKTSDAIKILMDEGMLVQLIVDLRNALESEEYQNKSIRNKFDPNLEDTYEKMTPIETELVESSGLSLQKVREILEMT